MAMYSFPAIDRPPMGGDNLPENNQTMKPIDMNDPRIRQMQGQLKASWLKGNQSPQPEMTPYKGQYGGGFGRWGRGGMGGGYGGSPWGRPQPRPSFGGGGGPWGMPSFGGGGYGRPARGGYGGGFQMGRSPAFPGRFNGGWGNQYNQLLGGNPRNRMPAQNERNVQQYQQRTMRAF